MTNLSLEIDQAKRVVMRCDEMRISGVFSTCRWCAQDRGGKEDWSGRGGEERKTRLVFNLCAGSQSPGQSDALQFSEDIHLYTRRIQAPDGTASGAGEMRANES